VKFGRCTGEGDIRRPNKGILLLLFFPTPLPTDSFNSQAFRGRLIEVIDQAQHFAALGPSGGGGPTGDSAQAFREGLDGTERERELSAYPGIFVHEADKWFMTVFEVFALAQESAKRTKRWYEDSDKGRRS
jgi:GINS complex subunit 3